ncbi:CYTH-like domain-containing protein [Phakopsora pachyrhizi]|uniref:mRNA-capping enzyme subunit beta n=1 Tax=Phakopsora pachyrhizi TaxID=170000 RepID=A0AAV0BKK6_PHAPC|nr:CYTH-like domain-containing protein [Phakopsora pachyrhizi]
MSINESSSFSSPKSASSSSLLRQSPLIDLDHSIFGISPYDDFIFSIARFIWTIAQPYYEAGEGELIEVEAKIGRLVKKNFDNGEERMWYPIGSETAILENDGSYRFESDMSSKQHQRLNKILNCRVQEIESVRAKKEIDYKHLRECDEFYENQVRVSREWLQQGQDGQSSQGSSHRNHSAGQIKRCIVKQKLGHLDICSPNRSFDFRISVNLERPVAIPNESQRVLYKRFKDRLSYSHQVCQIDLTQVRSSDNSITHELEVEIRDSVSLLRYGSQWRRGEEEMEKKKRKRKRNSGVDGTGEYEEEEDEEDEDEDDEDEDDEEVGFSMYLMMIEVLANNVRLLISNAGER